MTMKKKLACLTISLALAASLTLPALAVDVNKAFPVVEANPSYVDVIERDWFYSSVRTCAQVGLMKGTGNNGAGSPLFSPNQVLTVGEVAAIAARMNEAITGDAIPTEPTKPWYQVYVDYLEKLGVTVPDGAKQATRADFVAMLAAVLPEDMLEPINTITALPDTTDADVLAFYNAGILTGTDDWGTFAGSKSLTRAEAAAMAARVVRPEQRLKFTPADPRLLQAAGMAQDDVLFQSEFLTVTAGEFLPVVAERIAWLEGQAIGDFNWNHMYGDQTYKSYVLDGAYKELNVSEHMATDLYKTFDVQVFYSKLIDLGVEY